MRTQGTTQKAAGVLVAQARDAGALSAAEGARLQALFREPHAAASHLETAERLVEGALARVQGRAPAGPPDAAQEALATLHAELREQLRSGPSRPPVDRLALGREALKDAAQSLLFNKGRITGFALDPSHRSVMSPPGLETLLFTPLLLGYDFVAGPLVAGAKLAEAGQHVGKWVAGERLPAEEITRRATSSERAQHVAAELLRLNDTDEVALLKQAVEGAMKKAGSRDPYYCIALTGTYLAGMWSHSEEARLVISPAGIELQEKNATSTRGLRNPITGALRQPDLLAQLSVEDVKARIAEAARWASGKGG